ncbi:MAG: helix-hairpin-helix domain-containing protein [Eggerthellaceae bacterium]|jgi:competence protein ComEA
MPVKDQVKTWLSDLNKKSPSKSVLLGVCVIFLFVIATCGQMLWSLVQNPEVSFDQVEDASAVEERGSNEVGENSASLFVYVSGAVEKPGVYELSMGTRVNDAVELAGGLTSDADLEAINLARMLEDGEQINIPHKGSTTGSQTASQQGSTNQGKVNINTASIEELESLPGVGEATAKKIVDERESNGRFKSIEDLKRVSGIGKKKFEKLKDQISV